MKRTVHRPMNCAVHRPSNRPSNGTAHRTAKRRVETAAGRRGAALAAIVVAAALAACSSPGPRPGAPGARSDTGERPPVARGGGYYQDDGPGEHPPADLMSIPDAVPRPEPLLARANRPYVVFERQYQPMVELSPFRQRGVASWYGRKFHGRRTSSGEVYDMYAMTAAHPTLPIPSYARVTHLASGRSVVVRVNDRGPFLHDRVIDLSYTAAARLGYAGAGSAQVEVELITRFDGVPLEGVAASGPAAATAVPAVSAAPAARPAAATLSSGAAAVTDVRFVQVAASGAEALRPERLDVETVVAPIERAAPQRAPSERTSPERTSPERTTPERTTPERTSPERAPSERASPQRMPVTPPPDGPRPATVTTSPRSASAAPGASAPVADTGVFLQLGAFSTRENAEALRDHLESQLDTAVPLRVRADGAHFKVLMGPYPRRADALAAAERIAQRSGSRPFVVTR